MSYLQYDTEKIASTKSTYEKCVTEMDSIKKKMDKMVSSIRGAWDSDAGDAFFDKYDNEWLSAFNQYKEVLEHMAANLDVASNKYTEITELAKKLKIK